MIVTRQEYSLLVSIILCFLSISINVKAQEPDTTRTLVTTQSQGQQFELDSMGKKEFYALDIALDRGLFIVTADEKMQMRILGSVRFLVVNDFSNHPFKHNFNTFHMPIGNEKLSYPNYYADLNQTRLGFEVTRTMKNNRNAFIRLEMDFSGRDNGPFRIRHAYGQFYRFLIGQTWSLFSNVTTLPATVNFDGPTGSVLLRTPQVRYYGSNMKGTRWAVALEYSRPDVEFHEADSSGLSAEQIVPDLTARFEWEGVFGSVQLSGVLTTLSMLDVSGKFTNQVGAGLSLSGTIDFSNSQILYQYTYGSAISHFISNFGGTGNDAIYNPETSKVENIISSGGFIAYDYKILPILSSNISLGFAHLSNKEIQPDDAYKSSLSAALNTFWQVNEGARVGFEYMYGHRWNKNNQSDGASRIQMLFYYDF